MGLDQLLIAGLGEHPALLLDGEGCIRWASPAAERLYGYGPGTLAGRPLAALYPGSCRERGVPRQDLLVAAAEGKLEADRSRVRADGRERTVAISLAASTGLEVEPGFLELDRDVTEIRRRAASLRESEALLAGLIETMPAGLLLLAPDGQTKFATEGAARLLRRSRGELLRSCWAEPGPDLGLRHVRRTGEGAAGVLEWPLGNGEVVRLTYQSVPWSGGGAVVVLHEGYPNGEAQRERERLAEVARRLVEAQEAERRAVARELHDEIGQALTGLRYLLETLPEPADAARARAAVDDLADRVRSLSLALRPPMLDDLGLVPALAWLVERTRTTFGLDAALAHSGGERRLEPESETALFRIAQEALTNVARHAPGARAEVRLVTGQSVVRLEVEDNGRGFDPEAGARETGRGVAGMRDRALLLGGTFAVERAGAGGTRLRVELPRLEG